MGSSLPRDEAYIIAFWLGTLLFGVHIVIYILYIWVCRRRSAGAPILLTLTATSMLIVGGVQNFVGLQRIITAFWGNTGLSPADFLNETNITSNYIEFLSWLLQVILGDAFLTYRCWVIYEKRWWAAVPPLALVVATFCMGLMLLVEYSRQHSFATNLEYALVLFRWEAAMLSLTVAVNIGLTIAIAGRICFRHYHVMRVARRGGQEPIHMHIVWMMVESGVLIAIAQLLVLILGSLEGPGYQIVVHAVNPLIGIVFTGIIVRVQLSSHLSQSTSGESAPLDTIVVSSAITPEQGTLQHRHISFDTKNSSTSGGMAKGSRDNEHGRYVEELELTPFK